MQKQTLAGLHPLVIAWMGVVTGALIATLIFAAKIMEAVNYQAKMFMNAGF